MAKGTDGYKIRTITCDNCGKTVTRHLPPRQRFCSQLCAATSPKPQWRNGRVVACALCGKEFYLPARRLARASIYFCCVAHANEWQGRQKIQYTCKVCGKTFRWSPSRQKQNRVCYCSLACRDRDPARKEMLLMMCATQRGLRPNANEKRGRQIVSELAANAVFEVPIASKFIVDAVIEAARLVIQFDGDYWHGNPALFPVLDKRQVRRVQLDKSQDAYLRKCGYTVLRFWETDIRDRPEDVRHRILAALAPQ